MTFIHLQSIGLPSVSHPFWALLLIGLLTACGSDPSTSEPTSGGGSNASAPATNHSVNLIDTPVIDDPSVGPIQVNPVSSVNMGKIPKLSASNDEFVDFNVTAHLRGTATAQEGSTIVRTFWQQQQRNNEPVVAIANADHLEATIITPYVTEPTTLTFTFSAIDSRGWTNLATTAMTINPTTAFVHAMGGVVNEAEQTVDIAIRLNEPQATDTVVTYQTRDIEAEAGSDYIPINGSLTFTPGEMEKTISISIVDNDPNEENERFAIDLKMETDVGAIRPALVLITNNDALTFNDTDLIFQQAGPLRINLGQSLSNPINPSSLIGSGAITYQSSNTSIATVDNNGMVSTQSAGNVTITATQAAISGMASRSVSYQLSIQSGEPSIVPVVSLEASPYARSLASGDINGDGKPDLIVGNGSDATDAANNGIHVYLNNSISDWTKTEQVIGMRITRDIILSDIDQDGDLDMLAANTYSPSKLYLNDGSGFFVDSGQSLIKADSYGAAVGDLNNDGFLDIILSSFYSQTYVLFNDGVGNFSDRTQISGNFTGNIALSDFDRDGDIDFVLASGTNINFGESTLYYENLGAGVFNQVSGMGMPEANEVYAEDMDNDGDDDLILWEENDIYIYLNQGNATFENSGVAFNTMGTNFLAISDIDGDFDLDLVSNKMYINQGNMNFMDTKNNADIKAYAFKNIASNNSAVSDFNGDGRLDLAVIEKDENADFRKVVVYINND